MFKDRNNENVQIWVILLECPGIDTDNFTLGTFEIAEITNIADSFRIMSRARDKAMEALIRHHRHRDDGDNKLIRILFVLPILTGCCPRELAGELFAPIIDDADMERVIASVQ